MSKQLPALRKRPSMPPALILSCCLSLYIVVICGYAAANLVLALLVMNLTAAAIDSACLLLLIWYFGSYVIDTCLAIKLVKHIRAHNYAAAEMTYCRFLTLWQTLPLRKHGNLALAYSNLGMMRMLQGKFESADASLREAVRLVEANKKLSKHYLAAIPINNLAIVRIRHEQFGEADTLAKRALEIYERGKTGSTAGSAFPLVTMGSSYLLQGRYEESEQCLERAEAILESRKTPFLIMPDSVEHARIACKLNLALVRCKQDRLDKARELCAALLAQFAADDQYLTVGALRAITRLAQALIEHEEQALAERFLEHAYEIGRKYPDHPDTIELLATYTALLRDSGRTAELEDLRRWVRPVLMHRLIDSNNSRQLGSRG